MPKSVSSPAASPDGFDRLSKRLCRECYAHILVALYIPNDQEAVATGMPAYRWDDTRKKEYFTGWVCHGCAGRMCGPGLDGMIGGPEDEFSLWSRAGRMWAMSDAKVYKKPYHCRYCNSFHPCFDGITAAGRPCQHLAAVDVPSEQGIRNLCEIWRTRIEQIDRRDDNDPRAK